MLSSSELTITIERSFNESSSNCDDIFCNLFDEIGPFTGSLPPPPPIPPYLLQILNDNHSLADNHKTDDTCNFCHTFGDFIDSELVSSEPETKTEESWLSFSIFNSIFGLSIFAIILFCIFIKLRKRKFFSAQGKNLCFKQSPICSPPNHCIAPVINEKSPQSVILNCSTGASIRSKYWRRNDQTPCTLDGMIGSREETIEDYTAISDAASCTSSPVYAELDASGVAINRSQVSSSLLMNCPSPYASHTYSEIVDAFRMPTFGSSALLSDASYYNITYLPSFNSDLYQKRSLKGHRP